MFTTRERKKQNSAPAPPSKKQVSRDRTGVQKQPNYPPESTRFLQRYLGNSHLQSITQQQQTLGQESSSDVAIKEKMGTTIQTKLKVGQPGDKYEQEADRVAEQVMRMPEPQVQRQLDEEEDEELIQTKPLAEQIIPLVQKQIEGDEEDEELIQTKPLTGQIIPLFQRQIEGEEEEELLQAKEVYAQTSEVTPGLESQIQSLRGSGNPLPESPRAFFEPRFGYDFSDVRIHTDTQAAEMARAVNARSFTVGREVIFGTGQYAPKTSEGKRLLAHELTHVVQQSEGNLFFPGDKLIVNQPDGVVVQAADNGEGVGTTEDTPIDFSKPWKPTTETLFQWLTTTPAGKIIHHKIIPEGVSKSDEWLNLSTRLLDIRLLVNRGIKKLEKQAPPKVYRKYVKDARKILSKLRINYGLKDRAYALRLIMDHKGLKGPLYSILRFVEQSGKYTVSWFLILDLEKRVTPEPEQQVEESSGEPRKKEQQTKSEKPQQPKEGQQTGWSKKGPGYWTQKDPTEKEFNEMVKKFVDYTFQSLHSTKTDPNKDYTGDERKKLIKVLERSYFVKLESRCTEKTQKGYFLTLGKAYNLTKRDTTQDTLMLQLDPRKLTWQARKLQNVLKEMKIWLRHNGF